jgi:hypothetical protein
MDLNAIKSRLSALQAKPGGGQRKDLSETMWRPTPGKHTIRIVPSAYDKSNPFKDLNVHYGIGNAKVMLSITHFGETDPIVEFAKGLKNGQYDRENWSLAKKLSPKTRVFVPVIVRGEENKGVRLWEFGIEVYKELLAIAEDEDVQDYTDPVNGRDLTVEKLDAAAAGNSFGKTNIRVKTKITPLSEDANQVQAWLTNQPEPISMFKRFDYETMKANLIEFLSPGETPETVVGAVEAETPEAAPEAPKSNYTLEAKPKKSVDDEFDALFGN